MNSWAGIDEFLAVAHARSFVNAARRIGCSTSHVSREISRLEDRLGQRLFHRTTRHLSLTESGERLFERCRRLQMDRDQALMEILEKTDDLQGHLRMTCAVAYGERFIAPLVNQFMSLHPNLTIDLILDDAVRDLVDEGLDLAIRIGHLADSRFVAARLTSRTWRLCASPRYLERAGRPERLEDLQGHACIRGPTESWSFAREGQSITHRVHGRFRCNNGNAALVAVLAGMGVGQLPDFYLKEHLQCGALIELLSDCRPPAEVVWAVYPNRRHLPKKVRLMVQHLQANLVS